MQTPIRIVPVTIFSAFLFLLPLDLFAQNIGSSRGSLGSSARGLSSPRSEIGSRSNPISNPAPSLTPSEVLNPRGSLSAGQVVNPAPSLNRPGSGGAKPASQTNGNRTRRTDGATQAGTTQAGTARQTQPAREARKLIAVPAGTTLRASALDLVSKIEQLIPDGRSPLEREGKRLLEVDPESEVPNSAERRQLQTVATSLRAFQVGVVNGKDKEIIESPEFKKCRESLSFYLADPVERLRPQLDSAFAELRSSLRSFENGQSWQQYLIPKDFSDPTATILASGERTQALLKRYETISKDPGMSDVAELNGFEASRNALKRLVEMGAAATADVPAPTVSSSPDALSSPNASAASDADSSGTNVD